MRALLPLASILLAAWTALPAPVSGAPASAATAPAAVPAPDLIRLASDVRKTGPRLARLWPGYWPPGQAFVIYRPGHGALLVAEAAPAGFAPMSESGLPRSLRGRAWFRPGDLEGVNRPFILGYPVGAGRTAVLVIAEEGAEEVATLIFHEQFHDHQRKAFRHRFSSQFVGPKAVPDRVGFAAGAETERLVLAAALTATGRSRSRLLHQYLSLRRDREKGLPPALLKVERQFEKIEGTARFVDRAAKSLAPGADETLPELLAQGLRLDLVKNGQPFVEAWFRSRGYAIGAALTYLLRELDPKGWRATVEGTGTLDERLSELTGFGSVGDPEGLAQSARHAFGYDETKAALEPKIRAAEKGEIKSEEEFHALAAHRVLLEVKPATTNGAREVGMGFSTGSRGMTFLAEGHLVLPDPEVVDVTFPFGALTVRGRPFMSRSGPTNLYTILLPAGPSVNGATLAAGEHRFETLDLAAPGLILKVERPVTVVVGKRETVVRLR